MASKSLTFDIFGKDKTASKTIKGVGSAADKMGSKLTKMAGALGLALSAAAVVDWGKETVAALARIETLNAQTEAVIKSTGGAANVTGKHIEELADKLEKTTATEAESVQEGANLLLTFKNIRNEAGKGNDIYDQTVVAMTDMARAMGTDAKSGAIQLGKAINDPIKGIAALSRVGITFTSDQEKLIRSLVESGKTMEAQKLILKELQSQFGGSGAAYADTYRGKIDLLGHSWGEMSEKVMLAVMPALEELVDYAGTDLLPALDEVADWIVGEGIPGVENFVDWIVEWKDVLGPAATAIGILTGAQWALNIAMSANPIGLVIAALAGLIGIGVLVATNYESIWKSIAGFLLSIGTFSTGVSAAVLGTVETMVNTFIKALNDMLVPLNAILGLIGQPGIKIGNVDLTSGLRAAEKNLMSQNPDKLWAFSQGKLGMPRFASPAGGTGSGRGHYTLAEGGVVRARPGGVFANIGEGRYDEAVIPLSPEVLAQLGGGTKNITFNTTTSDPRLAVEAMSQRLRGGLVRL